MGAQRHRLLFCSRGWRLAVEIAVAATTPFYVCCQKYRRKHRLAPPPLPWLNAPKGYQRKSYFFYSLCWSQQLPSGNFLKNNLYHFLCDRFAVRQRTSAPYQLENYRRITSAQKPQYRGRHNSYSLGDSPLYSGQSCYATVSTTGVWIAEACTRIFYRSFCCFHAAKDRLSRFAQSRNRSGIPTKLAYRQLDADAAEPPSNFRNADLVNQWALKACGFDNPKCKVLQQ